MTLYDDDFYEKIGKGSYLSAQKILGRLFSKNEPSSLIDIGTGAGSWSLVASELGVQNIISVDGSDHGGSFLINQELKVIDLEKENGLSELPYSEFLMCLEVAEHLSKSRAESFVSELCLLSPVILFSAAIPYQGGLGHVNENWPEYWVKIFAESGYECFDFLRDEIWNDKEVEWWYRQNILIFVKSSHCDNFKLECGYSPVNDKKVLTRIHPEMYLTALHRDNSLVTNTLAQDQFFYRESIDYNVPNVTFFYGKEFPS